MPYSSITGWGSGKMNVLLILIAGLMLAGAETTLKSADFKPVKNDQMNDSIFITNTSKFLR
jgi:hypothetical protein